MRIIAGQFRSRRLTAPAGVKTRPTSDRLRETLFNVLQPRIVGARFADLYAGSGAVGFEALSRGAVYVEFAERETEALQVLRQNAESLGLREGKEFRIHGRHTEPALRAIAATGSSLDIVFLDPPYEAEQEYLTTLSLLASLPVLAPGAVVIAEHARRQPPPDSVGELKRDRILRHGDVALSFYAVQVR